MVKVLIIPNGEVPMPGSEKPMPADGVEVELTTYWQRLAEAGTVRIASDDAGQAAANGGGKPAGGEAADDPAAEESVGGDKPAGNEAAAGEAATDKPTGKKGK